SRYPSAPPTQHGPSLQISPSSTFSTTASGSIRASSAGANRRTPPTTGKPASSRLWAAAPRQPKAPAAARNTRRSMESIMSKPPLSGDWRQLEQGGVAGSFRQHPQSAVGTDLDITQALLALGQQPLFTYDPVPIQRQPRKTPTGKTGDEQTAFPGRRRIGVVKGH